MPNWIRDSGGRLVKRDTPHNKELELSLNIMEATPEDQHSHHGHQDNPNEFRSMRDRMHPPRMSAPSCIVPPTEQLVIRPILFHFYQLSMDGKTNGLKRQISNFSAKENEKFYECWERYMEAIMLVLTMAGMYTLNEDDMKAKFAAMTRRLEELELKKMHEVQAVAETPVQEMFGDQANVIGQFKPNNNAPYGNTYNSSWRNHPNFSWKPRAPQYQQPAQPSQQSSSLEQAIVNLSKVVGDFVGDQKAINAQLSQRIDSVENTLNKRGLQEKGRFPSQPHQNPKGIHEVETHEGESSQVRDVKALITLRSGKKVEPPTPKPHVEEKKRRDKEEGGNERKEERYQ
ncbi:hypothetical protein CK203_099393 [Vitis vinifera]|uniref:Retrotransposon gag domain-containing protein n=1 Tax=Vitis vinifera TaxID=29760 RepID=A0A438CHU1_VITVI|nr:hypothetical protein CK203_099393 [Vitis vinifera]